MFSPIFAGIMGRLTFIYFVDIFFEMLLDDDDEHCEMTCPSCDTNCTFVDQSQRLHFQYFHSLYPLATGLMHIEQISARG